MQSMLKETLIYSNQRESILLTLLVLRCSLAPPLRGGALIHVSLMISYKKFRMEPKPRMKPRISMPERTDILIQVLKGTGGKKRLTDPFSAFV